MYLPGKRWRGLSTPAGSPRLNDAHPLRGLLASAMVFNNTSAWDLCGPLGRGSVAYGTVTPTVGQVGQYLRVQDAGFAMQATLSGDFTIVVLGMRATTPPTSGPRGVAGLISTIYLAIAQRGIAMDMGNRYGDVNNLYMYHYTSPGVGFNAASAWVDGVKQSGTNPCDITISNGKWYGISATYTGVAAGTGNLTFGGLADGANYMGDGGVALCYVFPCVLPDGIQRDLSLDPGQMLVWPDDSLFAALRGPGGVVWDEALSDSVTAADDVAVVRVATVAQADSAAPADALAGSSIAAVALADAATAGDALAATSAAVVALADAGAAGDAVAAAAVVSVALADAGAAGDAVAGALAAAVSLADAATPDDAMTVAAALSAALEDSAAGVDSLLASLTTNVALQDALRAEDAVAWIVPNPLPPASRIYVVGPDGRSYALGRGSRVYVVARGARVVIVPGEE